MTLTLEQAEIPIEDEAPDTESPGYDPEAPYGYTKSGRVRKRPIGSKARDGAGTGSVRNATKARQATAALMQLNGFAVIGAMSMRMYDTAGALSGRQEKLEADIYNALVLDPSLCDTILKAGVKSGKIMLLIAVLTHAIAVAPDAIAEFKDRQAA